MPRLRKAIKIAANAGDSEARASHSDRGSVEPAAQWAAAAAAVVVFVAGTIAYELGHLRLTTNSQESYIAIRGSIPGRGYWSWYGCQISEI